MGNRSLIVLLKIIRHVQVKWSKSFLDEAWWRSFHHHDYNFVVFSFPWSVTKLQIRKRNCVGFILIFVWLDCRLSSLFNRFSVLYIYKPFQMFRIKLYAVESIVTISGFRVVSGKLLPMLCSRFLVLKSSRNFVWQFLSFRRNFHFPPKHFRFSNTRLPHSFFIYGQIQV